MKSDPLVFVGGKILQGNQFVPGNLLVENGKIESVTSKIPSRKIPQIEASGLKLIPGFIDLHLHCDFQNDESEHLQSISQDHARFGTTRFLATFCTSSIENLKRQGQLFKRAKPLLKGAQVLGCHLEGPFLNPKHAGAQPSEFIRRPSLKVLQSLIKVYGKDLRLMTLAPELKGILPLILYLKSKKVCVSMGHTDASYEEALEGVRLGIRYGTHVFNQMRRIHHRELGATGAALFDERIFAELIADGVHVHPLMVKLALQVKGFEKFVLATDCFMHLKGNDTRHPPRLSSGTLAGSALSLRRAVLNLIKFANLNEGQAIQTATLNPARVLKIDRLFGSLEPGKWADVVLVDQSFNVKMTMVGGRIVYRR
ncbi:MAG: N-acetylglucosamine-6-phosphate deacetylase [Chlamydiae bacterium]|nr:N-acetylglucosamine-6-phosphate deacetylase [Chlamydiota bacterium]MBI3266244.1 N-acetylglucosamine-6-phosphate deacetylase [Chlamydiota bacterium]